MNTTTRVTAAVLAAGLAWAVAACRAESSDARTAPASVGGGRGAERDRAFGYFLDSPRPFEVLDQGLEIAEKLRRRYGIDTGNPEADRRAAALRFQSEVLDRVEFSQAEIENAARRLGYSLDPAVCLDTCGNVRRLAVIELEKRALRTFADGDEMPGRLP